MPPRPRSATPPAHVSGEPTQPPASASDKVSVKSPAVLKDVNAKHPYLPPTDPKRYVPKAGEAYEGLLGPHYKDQPLLSRLHYLHVGILFGVPALGLWGAATIPWRWPTIVWALFYYYCTGLGITMGACGGGEGGGGCCTPIEDPSPHTHPPLPPHTGYHRLFAHRCYSATAPLKVLMLLLGGAYRWPGVWMVVGVTRCRSMLTPHPPPPPQPAPWRGHAAGGPVTTAPTTATWIRTRTPVRAVCERGGGAQGLRVPPSPSPPPLPRRRGCAWVLARPRGVDARQAGAVPHRPGGHF